MGRHSERRTLKVSGFLAPYDPTVFPENECSNDLVASVLGAAVDGWVPELLYRYTLYRGLYIDWAIMIYARPADGDPSAPRRRVERIDICESEVHVHRFRRSGDPDDDQGERTAIMSLNSGDEATVSNQWDVMLAQLSREWPKRMRRWLDG